ncbi:MAG: fused MFS/spermidine synthase [Chloroflexi bacterium]|nr:fused MFS/spermidine synthase [Chloroflexota bacterium]
MRTVMDAPARRAVPPLLLFGPVIFLSAFLLFQVQPIIGRFVLPWFGGGSSVWITTLLFFQTALLAGYAYAHLLSGRLPPRAQTLLHVALLAAAALVLPVIPDDALRPAEGAEPTTGILLLLALTVGAPYVLLSTTGPLLQRWFAEGHRGQSPYPLYALSNAGSLLALLSYPVLVEPWFGLRAQAWTWSAGYVVFAAGTAAAAWWYMRTVRPQRDQAPERREDGWDTAPRPAARQVGAWIVLPAIATALLLSGTNQLTQDAASVPLLWVLPLAIYLLTFILCFSSDRAYDPPVFTFTLITACIYALFVLYRPFVPLGWQLVIYSSVIFFGCMSLHGETVRLKPHPRYLTLFYLAVATGGALGGALVALAAPAVFNGYWEYHVALWATALVIVVIRLGEIRGSWSTGLRPAVTAVSMLALFGFGGMLLGNVQRGADETIAQVRSFYSVTRISERVSTDSGLVLREMQHGRIIHGIQRVDPAHRRDHVGYYGPLSGIGVAVAHYEPPEDRPRRVGVLGLGAGMVVTYAEPGETWVFYEIDPTVTELAETYFTYLADARDRGVTVEVRHGDGRRLLEQEVAAGETHGYDLLLMDAFSGDSVPVHLLTLEAFDLYWQHLRPDGVLAVHISNLHIDLSPVVRGAAAERGLHAAGVADPGAGADVFSTVWVLVTANEAFLAAAAPWIDEWPERARTPRVWTDDRSDLYGVIQFR